MPTEDLATSAPVESATPGVAGAGGVAATGGVVPGGVAPTAPGAVVPGAAPATALSWVRPDQLGNGPVQASYGNEYDTLVTGRPRRSPWRAGVLMPIGVVALVLAAYVGGTLLWPLHALPPTVTAQELGVVPAPAATPQWPAEGSAAVAVAGIPGDVSSTLDRTATASIAKLVTALVVLDEQPLAPGEQGPEYRFTASDQARMWQLNRSGESVLPVPVGGTLSQYQLLQGLLIGSAGNYAERLTGNLYPSPAIYARAANTWLARHGVSDITIVDPSGIGQGNLATPAALLQLGELAMANPVIAEIVAQQTAEIPGAGLIKNTNPLLGDPGVVGLKTGYLNGRNLLAAKRVVVDDTSIMIYAVVLDQPTSEERADATRALFDETSAALEPYPALAKGEVAGTVQTPWGETVDVLLGADAKLIGWNGSTGTASSTFDLGNLRSAGDTVGELHVAGPINTANVELVLGSEIEGPSAWWRLTHPLELLGLR